MKPELLIAVVGDAQIFVTGFSQFKSEQYEEDYHVQLSDVRAVILKIENELYTGVRGIKESWLTSVRNRYVHVCCKYPVGNGLVVFFSFNNDARELKFLRVGRSREIDKELAKIKRYFTIRRTR